MPVQIGALAAGTDGSTWSGTNGSTCQTGALSAVQIGALVRYRREEMEYLVGIDGSGVPIESIQT